MSVNTSAHAEQRRDRALDEEQPLEGERPVQSDPKATQRLRLADTPALKSASGRKGKRRHRADASVTQPIRREPELASAQERGTEGAPARRQAVRSWVARHKRTLILVGVLVGIAILAISGVAIRSGQGVQQATVGLFGPQLRAARLAQADLSGEDLKWANLSQADLRQANLSRADLLGANLNGANLEEANLEGAILRGADLSGAKLGKAFLMRADLHWAILRNSDLRYADLSGSDLQGADLENATLEGADLEGANLKNAHTVGTILPDGMVWKPSVNLRRFTDPSHPDFWRPGDVQSLVLR